MQKLWFKRILFLTGGVFMAIQFIRPNRNDLGSLQSKTDLIQMYQPTATVASSLKNACYDCHSNLTCYPWYFNIQPLASMMESHVRDGKDKLNFSEFASYLPRRQASKFKEMEGTLKANEMPLKSYTLMHKGARLKPKERGQLIEWIQNKEDSLSEK